MRSANSHERHATHDVCQCRYDYGYNVECIFHDVFCSPNERRLVMLCRDESPCVATGWLSRGQGAHSPRPSQGEDAEGCRFFRAFSVARSGSAAMCPTTFRTNLTSTVRICPLIPLGTFSPAFAHWLTRRSAFASCEVTGTTNMSPGQLPCPITMAGLTFELLKSVNGIGSKTTSPREQIIVNVVSFVVPDTHERPLPLVQPCPPLHVVLPDFQ